MRLPPRTWLGKLRLLAVASAAALTILLVAVVVFWPVMSFVVAALLALYGAVTVVAVGTLIVYLALRRRRLDALRLDWRDEEAPTTAVY